LLELLRVCCSSRWYSFRRPLSALYQDRQGDQVLQQDLHLDLVVQQDLYLRQVLQQDLYQIHINQVLDPNHHHHHLHQVMPLTPQPGAHHVHNLPLQLAPPNLPLRLTQLDALNLIQQDLQPHYRHHANRRS